MKKIILATGILTSTFLYSQVGINTETPRATLDVTGKPSDMSKIDGFIVPRLAGSELKAKDALYGADQNAALVYVTTPLATSDTSAKTINVTSSGYYFYDAANNLWQKLNATGSGSSEPWYDSLTNLPATQNSQNIYQSGNVAIGKSTMVSDIALDVEGNFHMGTNHSGSNGLNSAAFGNGTTASGENSTAFGWNNKALGINAMTWGGNEDATSTTGSHYNEATGVASTAFGYSNVSSSWGTTAFGTRNTASAPQATVFGASNVASGFWSTAFGRHNISSANRSLAFGLENTASGGNSVAFGYQNTASSENTTAFGERNKAEGSRTLAFGLSNTASGHDAVAFGSYNIASSVNETVFGRYAAITTSSNTTQWVATDPVLQIGNGNDQARSNALTVLKNGNIGIGEIAPTTKLEINNGTTNGAIKIVDGTQGAGKILTSDANGLATWQDLATGTGNDWSILGNSGTTAGTNFIGTTDTQDFIVKTNNTERERTYNTVDTNNTIKTITGGDLNLNGLTVGRGSGNKDSNAVFGYESLKANDTGGNNVAMGSFALYNSTKGFSNVAIGHSAMTGNTEGNSNIAIGQSTLPYNTTGDLNVAIGHSALSNPLNKTGHHNIGIGFTAGGNLEDATSNNIAIGSFQDLAISTGSNQLNIGGAIFGTGLTGTQAAPAGNIGIGTTAPSTRLEVNNGSTNGAIKIVDGTQGAGKILTSDAEGVGTWQAPKVSVVKGEIGGYDLPFEQFSGFRYTGASITLPPGKWLVTITQFTYITGNDSGSTSILISPDDWMLVRSTFSDQTNVTTVGQVASPSADITQPSSMTFTVSGPHREDSKTGVIFINNTSGGNKTYKYIAGNTEVTGTISGGFLNNFAGNWAENSITAIAIN